MKKRILAYIFMLSILIISVSACVQSKQIPDPQVTHQFEQQSTDTPLETNKQLIELTPLITPEEIKQDEIILLDDFSVAVEVTHTGIEELDFEFLQALGVKYIRFNGILWSEIQPTENSFVWDGMSKIEDFFHKADQYGMTVIPIIRGTPVWAQKEYGYYCGAISEEKLNSFGDFMMELVNRYKTDEYNIHYWEIWNEPDVHPQVVKKTSQYGCWGDINDQYYGGGFFAEMLKDVTPVIRKTDPQAKVLIGGLLLDCDPRQTGSGYCPTEERTIGPKFLEGILLNGGGEYFDIVSFHGYTPDGNFNFAPWVLEETFPNWSARGGVVMAKYNYIKELLSNYELEKDVFLTETGYLCLENNLSCRNELETFYNRQAQYGVWLMMRNWVEGINQSFWYTFDYPGWREGSMLDIEQKPKPVYNAIQVLNGRMQGAKTAQKLAGLPGGLQGYAFYFDDRVTWLVVSSDNDPHTLDMSIYDFSVFDIFNNTIENKDEKLEIFYPVYIDIEN